MNLAGDILDKYTPEQVTAYLDKVLAGVLQNYKIATEKQMPELLYISLSDLIHVRAILKEMRKRDDAREAQKQEM